MIVLMTGATIDIAFLRTKKKGGNQRFAGWFPPLKFGMCWMQLDAIVYGAGIIKKLLLSKTRNSTYP